MAEQSPEEIEKAFYSWRAPRQAVDDIKDIGSWGDAREEILVRCKSGLLDAAAATFVHGTQQGEKTDKFVIVPRSVWLNFGPSITNDFWKSGTLTWHADKYGIYGRRALFGVRFDPAGLDAIRRDAGLDDVSRQSAAAPPTEERKTRHGLPTLKDELLRAWYELFLKAYPNGSKTLAEKSAPGMFPDHSVDRQKVRDLYGPGKMGRPLKDKDK